MLKSNFFSKYTLKRTKLHSLKNILSGEHAPEPLSKFRGTQLAQTHKISLAPWQVVHTPMCIQFRS